MRIISSLLCCLALAASDIERSAPALAHPSSQNAVKFTSIYSFKGHPDGQWPQGSVILVGGSLYGTTYLGGTIGSGTVFKIDPGFERVLHSFAAGPDGQGPFGRPLDVNGTVFGTTTGGGSSGNGTVFKITTSGKETVLYSFSGAPDGSDPVTGLLDINGTLYGTTVGGGSGCSGGCGTVFKMTPSGAESVLYRFTGAPDGAEPRAELIDVAGTLYGTTYTGGSSSCNCGTVYKITPAGAETVLHSFTNGADGAYPQGSLLEHNGALYGATSYGGAGSGGTVFKVTATGVESVVHSFSYNGAGGAGPGALTAVNGTLYGVLSGGTANGDGAVFALTTSGSARLLYTFSGPDGQYPEQNLIYANGTLYGMTYRGGVSGNGTIFSIRL